MDPTRAHDDTDIRQAERLAAGQNRILELIATGTPLPATLDRLVRFLESETPEMCGSVLLLDADGLHLRHGAAPSLPETYASAIDGGAIGPAAGSCGTAAWRRAAVIVEDIETDPLWAGFRDLARPHGLRACWSTPIFGVDARVLGTFAMYFGEPRRPEPRHQRIIAAATHMAAIAIEKEQREHALHESEERYRLLSLATNDIVWDWDIRRDTLWWSDGVERIFGYARDDVPPDLSWWIERMHDGDRARVEASFRAAAARGNHDWREEYRFRRRDGSYADIQDRGYLMLDASGAPVRLIGAMQDITAQKAADVKIRDLAYYEPVTRLPNRVAMQAHLADAVADADATGHETALMLVNLNGFRDVNDSLGHQNGDRLLRHVAGRLRAALAADDDVASLGGDEFAILLPRLTGASGLDAALRRVHEALEDGMLLAAVRIAIEATLGVAIYPRHGSTPDELWQHADVALRTAKERHEPHRVYSPEIDHYDPVRLALLGELPAAIAAGQLVLHYQPRIDLSSGRTTGAEALVRWNHPTRGLLLPDVFIPLAEQTGLINPIAAAVLTDALQQGLAFDRAGLPLEIAVNLSARNFHDRGFCDGLLALISGPGFPLPQLTLEVTESAIMADPGRARAVLAELQRMGIGVSIDDFGVGYSSLANLKDLPANQIKLDKSFARDLDRPRNAAVVRSAIDLARNMGLQITAEGVENEVSYRTLRDLGCDVAQGWFFSGALPADAFTVWLRESPWGHRAAAGR